MRTGHAPERIMQLVRRELPTCPRKVVRKMCRGTSKCAEIRRSLCGVQGATAEISHSIGVGFPRMCAHEFRAIFAQIWNFFTQTRLDGQNMSQPLCSKTASFCVL